MMSARIGLEAGPRIHISLSKGIGEGRGGPLGGAWGAFGKEPPVPVQTCPYFPIGILALVKSSDSGFVKYAPDSSL